MQIKELVKKTAFKLNIDLCRITNGSELKNERKILEKRARSKYWPQAFTNQNLDQLTKPALHFKDLKSIIVAAVSYNNGGGSPFLSNYVTVKDYHNYLQDKLEKLAAEMQQKLDQNFNYKIFVDTAPFLERALARKAGIGFIGKNSMLINPEFGSFLFLGEIFTDLEMEPDPPLEIDCGECQICIKNCEGQALKAEYLLDAEDCISYLTQKKGILNQKEVKKIGAHIWGCDACQEKCPYNKNISQTAAEKLHFLNRDLEYFLKLDRKNPPSELEETAIMWRGSRILLRNALIAAANLGEEKYFDLVKENLNDNSPVIRYYAVLALLEIDYKRAEKIVKKAIKNENNREYKEKMIVILEEKEAQYEY
ncbi:epoxyqueuosine reductase [Halanaerobium saccharolyticum]|uniref:Epoxyqueuosine reductase n=1 Tax=Halanaerobium saccharolyticum TaxID=43595 RepID=A0A4R7YS36_9FIRM|nr:tRNA epoxyqueuosine(34) reductase QueG [Halanaerobium saccharolyticum]RAK06182.1 epoxyqueuosine reductase [Halanaerobium saccharolyticum]TDW00547.1 epoxyqueuosine reductase [Halanaerobium saccharolyticum]TDX52212.1 epoxyqueuosine reductase [Halanaerobium saccharolyticum]